MPLALLRYRPLLAALAAASALPAGAGEPVPDFSQVCVAEQPDLSGQRALRACLANAQARFGIGRHVLIDVNQTIDFADIALWDAAPAGHPDWVGITLATTP